MELLCCIIRDELLGEAFNKAKTEMLVLLGTPLFECVPSFDINPAFDKQPFHYLGTYIGKDVDHTKIANQMLTK
ncbi:hypothetical protein GGF43_004478, partial [Coemansia sp. RSA 2618]